MRSPCPCQAAERAAVQHELLRAVATEAPSRERGRLRVDRAALRKALGGREELVEAMEAKAVGRPGANVGKLWKFLTASLYQSGDLPVLATRETLQNAVDAVKAAVRARKTRAGTGRFEVTWDPERRSLSWQDNGIGMSAPEILTRFLTIGESGKAAAGDSDEAAGGFGVAKAVILGASSTVHPRPGHPRRPASEKTSGISGLSGLWRSLQRICPVLMREVGRARLLPGPGRRLDQVAVRIHSQKSAGLDQAEHQRRDPRPLL